MEHAESAQDVVCGMEVDIDEAEKQGLWREYRGQRFYFCGAGCKRRFGENPQPWVG